MAPLRFGRTVLGCAVLAIAVGGCSSYDTLASLKVNREIRYLTYPASPETKSATGEAAADSSRVVVEIEPGMRVTFSGVASGAIDSTKTLPTLAQFQWVRPKDGVPPTSEDLLLLASLVDAVSSDWINDYHDPVSKKCLVPVPVPECTIFLAERAVRPVVTFNGTFKSCGNEACQFHRMRELVRTPQRGADQPSSEPHAGFAIGEPFKDKKEQSSDKKIRAGIPATGRFFLEKLEGLTQFTRLAVRVDVAVRVAGQVGDLWVPVESSVCDLEKNWNVEVRSISRAGRNKPIILIPGESSCPEDKSDDPGKPKDAASPAVPHCDVATLHDLGTRADVGKVDRMLSKCKETLLVRHGDTFEIGPKVDEVKPKAK